VGQLLSSEACRPDRRCCRSSPRTRCPGATLTSNAGFAHGEAIGEYRGGPLYHASLDDAEYENLPAHFAFTLIEHTRAPNPVKGGRIAWIARAGQPS
jgi:hypothetical protein